MRGVQIEVSKNNRRQDYEEGRKREKITGLDVVKMRSTWGLMSGWDRDTGDFETEDLPRNDGRKWGTSITFNFKNITHVSFWKEGKYLWLINIFVDQRRNLLGWGVDQSPSTSLFY